jgi:hypothetical protein
LRVIGWDAHEGVCQSNGGIVDARDTDILVANNDLRRKSAPAADQGREAVDALSWKRVSTGGAERRRPAKTSARIELKIAV